MSIIKLKKSESVTVGTATFSYDDLAALATLKAPNLKAARQTTEVGSLKIKLNVYAYGVINGTWMTGKACDVKKVERQFRNLLETFTNDDIKLSSEMSSRIKSMNTAKLSTATVRAILNASNAGVLA